ncbi:MAG: hypothetical protein JO141_31930 [Bradyrhizobium sp.]|nr:hypothetical protein [Bradyrhizobium sp.]
MSHVTAKVVSTLLIGVAAAAVSTALPSRIVNAADSCLTEPKGDSAGKHWYYHIERGSGRHCWYQRGQEDGSARTDDDKQAASGEAPSSNADGAAARTFADAHAEIAPKPTRSDSINAAAAPSVWPSPQASSAPANNATETAPAQSAPDSALASRWPQSADAAAPSPSPQPDAAHAQDNTVNANTANANAAEVPPPPAANPAPPERRSSSIQQLLLVAFGALTLAGLTGSGVYRLGRRRRRNDWLRERNAWQDPQNPNRAPWVDEPRLRSNQDVADLDDRQVYDDRHAFDSRRLGEPESDFPLAMSETEAGSDRVEKIEDFLARLTEQVHQELEGTRPHRA